jgi:LacI family transcriptional regulator
MRAHHITIKDLARHLNLSVSTISRAFNDKYDVKPETRKLVLETADKLGYRPNPIAKKLLQRCTYNIGVVVPEILTSFFPKVITGIQDVFIKNGYQVLLMQSKECYTTELDNIKFFENSMVDGMVISLSKETKNIDYINRLIKQGLPVVMFNRVNPGIQAPKVVFNDYKWSFFATEHLIYQGYKKIYHFASPLTFSLSKQRIQGFRDALKKHGISFSPTQIIESGLEIHDGEAITNKLLREKHDFDAICSSNDRAAIGAMKVLKKNRINIPEEVGVMGFSESSLATVVEPGLTSVQQPTYNMGTKVAELLLKLIQAEQDTIDPQDMTLNGKINIRESTCRIK